MKNRIYKDNNETYIIDYDRDALNDKKKEIIKSSAVKLEKNKTFDRKSDEYRKFKEKSINEDDVKDFDSEVKDIIIRKDYLGGDRVDVVYIHTEVPKIARLIENFLNHKDANTLYDIFSKNSENEIVPYTERVKLIRDELGSTFDTAKRMRLANRLSVLISTAKYNTLKTDPRVFYDSVKNMIFKKENNKDEQEEKTRGAIR